MTLGHTKLILLASAATVLVAGTPVRAADAPAAAPVMMDKHTWDIAFGVTFTSDYISRGATQTDYGPAVQPWAELTINDCFYIGYWGSNVSFGTKDWENDLSIGIRPTWGPVSFDFGYVRYIYSSNIFPAYGEVYAKASFSPMEPLTLGVAIYANPENSDRYYEANASVDIHNGFSVSGAVGSNTVGGVTTTPWNIGVSWAPQDWVKLDGRYYAGPTADKWVAALTFQTTAKSLGIIK
jgi:uncharacterized protein (TIGR02001 family)